MADAYSTLGVPRGASEQDIKKAYRKLASTNHPDKGGDTAKFQAIQGAYETLTDPVKRQQHDNPNPFAQAQAGQGGGFEFQFGGGDMHDLFSQVFGAGGHPFQQRQQPRKNKDLRINLQVTLADTLWDQQKKVSVQATKGDRFEVDVGIPRGVSNGTTIKYTGQGDNFFDSLTRGDLYVIITIQPDANFEVHGPNVLTTLEITGIEAITGCDKSVIGIDGKEFTVAIPKACQYGTKFGLSQQGLYQLNGAPVRGDLIVNVKIVTPELTEEQLSILRNLDSDS
jgi:DnaJ-class molecular chaperone|tara:strand:+ start:6038 stop:6883 length:846 start_codon:yes stop_codon:yes gene_type:complete